MRAICVFGAKPQSLGSLAAYKFNPYLFAYKFGLGHIRTHTPHLLLWCGALSIVAVRQIYIRPSVVIKLTDPIILYIIITIRGSKTSHLVCLFAQEALIHNCEHTRCVRGDFDTNRIYTVHTYIFSYPWIDWTLRINYHRGSYGHGAYPPPTLMHTYSEGTLLGGGCRFKRIFTRFRACINCTVAARQT